MAMFTPCSGCPTPAYCKRMGRCRKRMDKPRARKKTTPRKVGAPVRSRARTIPKGKKY